MSRKTKQPSDWLVHPAVQTALCLLGAAFTAWQVGYFPTYCPYFLKFGIVLAVVFVALWVCLLLTGKEPFRWILAIVFALAFYTMGVRLAASVLGDSSILLGYALFLRRIIPFVALGFLQCEAVSTCKPKQPDHLYSNSANWSSQAHLRTA